MTRFVIITAHDPNLVIGKDGALPWRIPEDLQHFKKTTLGFPVLMGRGVFEELNEKPLPGRENFVLTSRNYEQVTTFKSIPEAVKSLKEDGFEKVFIIGGGKIYSQMMDYADALIITEIHQEYDGDTFFPEYRHTIGEKWKEVSREDFEKFSFVEYERLN